MRSILLMALKNIKKKPLQNVLITMIICISALVLSTGIGMLKGFDSPVENMFAKLNASQDFLYITAGTYNTDDISNWWKQQPEIDGVSVYNGSIIDSRLTIKNKQVNDTLIRLTERENIPASIDKLLIVSGKQKNCPDKGEIWVPTGFAYNYDIKVGDILNIPTKNGNIPAKVSAIVVDPHSSSTLMGTIQFWTAPGDLKNTFRVPVNSILIGTHYRDYSKADKVWNAFEQFLKAPFGGYKTDYSGFKNSYTSIFKIEASILVTFSLIVIVCVLFIIAFTISNAILSDFRIIGILKAQGFTTRQIQAIYLIQFLLLSIIAIPFGVVGSYFCINQIMSNLLKATGINTMESSMFFPAIVTTLIILTLTALCTFISSKKSCKIKPSSALKAAPEGNESTNSYASIIRLKRFPISISLSMKQLVSYKKQTTLILITLFLTSFVFIAAFNSYNSLLRLGNNLAFWGFDNSEVTIEVPSEYGTKAEEKLLNYLKMDDSIKSTMPYCWSRVAYKSESGTSKIIEILAYDGNMNSIGLANIRGRNPITTDEVSLAVNTSKDMKKDIGDCVDLYILGHKKTFIVTGIYQSIANYGTGVRLQGKALGNQFSSSGAPLLAIKLKASVNSKAFISEIQAKYGYAVNVRETSDTYESITSTITNNISYALLFLIIVFAIVTFIVIFNITLIAIYQQKKDFGIFKAIGMTNFQIRLSIICRILFASLIGVILGIPISIITVPPLIGIATTGMGLVKFPYIPTTFGSFGVILLSMLIVFIGVSISSRKILELKLNSLINE